MKDQSASSARDGDGEGARESHEWVEGSGGGHPSADWLAMHAVDALSPEGARVVERHLVGCAGCRAELSMLRESAALLAEVATPLAPPPGLRARILARVRLTNVRSNSGTSTRPPRRTGVWPLVAAASLLVTLGSSVALLRLSSDRADLRSALARAEHVAAERASELSQRDALLARVLGPDVELATLAATGATPSLRLFRDRARGEIVVSAHRLPPAAPGRTFQLWAIGADGRPIGVGTFNTAADGSTVVVLTFPSSASFDVSAVTEEPEGGSPAPTSAPFLVGRWGE